MKGLLETFKNIWRIEELRKRILITLGLLLVYRIGSFIVLPGVDSARLAGSSSGGSGLVDLLSIFTGGAFTRASIFALGVMPYISASIIMQLAGIAIPAVQKMQREESGRRKINQWTRYITIIISLFQAPGYILTYVDAEARPVNDPMWMPTSVVILTCSTLFIMWIGERITERGLGNGVSLIIMIGILARLPESFIQEFVSRMGGGGGLVAVLMEVAFWLLIIAGNILLVQGTRRIPVQFAKRVVGNKQYGGVRNYVPLKVNAAGVMPIIFAQAIVLIPMYLTQIPALRDVQWMARFSDYKSVGYNITLFLMVVAFTYFYTAITVNPNQLADDMKRNGGFIPGVKPGKATAGHIDELLSRITLPGAIFLGIVAILPALAGGVLGIKDGFAQFFGGTSLLIMVGVLLDTLQQIESHLLMRHYDGLMKTSRIKGRQSATYSSMAAG